MVVKSVTIIGKKAWYSVHLIDLLSIELLLLCSVSNFYSK